MNLNTGRGKINIRNSLLLEFSLKSSGSSISEKKQGGSLAT